MNALSAFYTHRYWCGKCFILILYAILLEQFAFHGQGYYYIIIILSQGDSNSIILVYNFTVRDFDQAFILGDIILLVHYVDYIILLESGEHEIVAI